MRAETDLNSRDKRSEPPYLAPPLQAKVVIVGRPAALKAPFAVLTGQLRAALGSIPGPRPAP